MPEVSAALGGDQVNMIVAGDVVRQDRIGAFRDGFAAERDHIRRNRLANDFLTADGGDRGRRFRGRS